MHPLAFGRLGLNKQSGAPVTWLPLPGGSSLDRHPRRGERQDGVDHLASWSFRDHWLMPARILASMTHAAAHILEPPCVGDSQVKL